MSNESQTAAKSSSDPVLCKMGCGFFGSTATSDCCSKCYLANMKKQGVCVEPTPAPVVETPSDVSSEPEPMDMDVDIDVTPVEVKLTSTAPPAACAAPVATTAPSKKKKKKSYKNLMAGMMKCSPERDVEQEKEQLRKVTGGGTFSKIDKI